MSNLDLSTILVCIQSVQKQIEYFEGLLESETVRDKAEIQELLLSYDQAAENLKEAYIAMRTPGSNYPEYESLIKKNL
ncbi:hypothetical protein BTA51_13930 [Hahella sp. CCB-MM4]|uniref:hypothetical protein n=1 Tax=Hahella sp. (strain CCB-MM4) TaxID=1926491 RepID=UPI000B9B38F0|nr:hypothetical protein [Hahella sp. CCB-MM4]OZG72624.1 hypothetical protein BTA51_13930 [Hahella sp. CCB-MM4]